jgi:hypothetical protein
VQAQVIASLIEDALPQPCQQDSTSMMNVSYQADTCQTSQKCEQNHQARHVSICYRNETAAHLCSLLDALGCETEVVVTRQTAALLLAGVALLR